jgi:hypothetical protein
MIFLQYIQEMFVMPTRSSTWRMAINKGNYNQTRWSGKIFYLYEKLQAFYWTFDITQW